MLFRYDPKIDQWTTVASMSVPRDAVGISVLGGKLYACGGYDGKILISAVYLVIVDGVMFYTYETLTPSLPRKQTQICFQICCASYLLQK